MNFQNTNKTASLFSIAILHGNSSVWTRNILGKTPLHEKNHWNFF
jgi:hypothetical protein